MGKLENTRLSSACHLMTKGLIIYQYFTLYNALTQKQVLVGHHNS